MRWFRSLTVRMIVNHLLVTMLASALGGACLAALFFVLQSRLKPEDYAAFATLPAFEWLFGGVDGQPNPPNQNVPAGYSLLVSAADQVEFSQGDTTCRAGMHLKDCAPDLIGSVPGQRAFMVDGVQWSEVVVKTTLNQRAITQRAPAVVEPCIFISEVIGACSRVTFTLSLVAVMTTLSLPVALILGWLSARPLIRRLHRITDANRYFSAGDFTVRVHDPNRDEIGTLAAQFDDTAATLAQNVITLRELAERNAQLAQAAEDSAIRAERVRLSRDLHDAIAQRLFSLSVSAANLPAIIERDPQRGVEQARAVASLSEQTLLELRTLLVEMRPSMVMQRGLNEALRTLCNEWSSAHHIQIEYSALLSGQYLASPLEDAAYRIVQEALSNIDKHANADAVHISLLESQRQLTVSITDNGCGFNHDRISERGAGHFGLITMQERAQALGGMVIVESDTLRGTTIRANLPTIFGNVPT